MRKHTRPSKSRGVLGDKVKSAGSTGKEGCLFERFGTEEEPTTPTERGPTTCRGGRMAVSAISQRRDCCSSQKTDVNSVFLLRRPGG